MNRKQFIKNLGISAFIPVVAPVLANSKTNNNGHVEYYDNGWHNIKFENIKDGMYVRMFENNGESVIMGEKNGFPIYCATVEGDAFMNNDGIPSIFCKAGTPCNVSEKGTE